MIEVNLDNSYVEFVEDALHFKNIVGEIEKKYYLDGNEMQRDIVKIPQKHFGIMCVSGIDTCSIEITNYEKFIIEAMKYFEEYTFEEDPTINLCMTKITYDNHNCKNANVIKTTICSDSDLCEFHYYNIYITLKYK